MTLIESYRVFLAVNFTVIMDVTPQMHSDSVYIHLSVKELLESARLINFLVYTKLNAIAAS